jgi:hypothetical protein
MTDNWPSDSQEELDNEKRHFAGRDAEIARLRAIVTMARDERDLAQSERDAAIVRAEKAEAALALARIRD